MNDQAYRTPPDGWAIINHHLPHGASGQVAKISSNDPSARQKLSVAKAKGLEIRAYFKNLEFLGLKIQTQAIYTMSPAHTVQGFHSHDGSCLEITLVVAGQLMAIEHPTLGTDEIREMLTDGGPTCMDRLQALGIILDPTQMHISDPKARHTLVALEPSSFWTIQLPPPLPHHLPFNPKRLAL